MLLRPLSLQRPISTLVSVGKDRCSRAHTRVAPLVGLAEALAAALAGSAGCYSADVSLGIDGRQAHGPHGRIARHDFVIWPRSLLAIRELLHQGRLVDIDTVAAFDVRHSRGAPRRVARAGRYNRVGDRIVSPRCGLPQRGADSTASLSPSMGLRRGALRAPGPPDNFGRRERELVGACRRTHGRSARNGACEPERLGCVCARRKDERSGNHREDEHVL